MWNIGGAINHEKLFKIVKSINKVNPQLISGVYDCYELLRWNGGRPFNTNRLRPEFFFNRIEELNKLNISFFHTFTNNNISKSDLDDKWANAYLERTHQSINGVICNSLILVDYLRSKYPKFKILGSCTILESNIENLKTLQGIYDVLILPPHLNRRTEIVDNLDLSKLEVMVSETCYVNCKVRKLHYQLINKWNYTHDPDDYFRLIDFCFNNPGSCMAKKMDEKGKKNELFSTKEEIEVFKNKGVKLFKLQDRAFPQVAISNIIRFIILYSNENIINKIKLLNSLNIGKYELFKKISKIMKTS